MTTYAAVVAENNGDVHATCGHNHRSAAAAEPCRERMLRHHPRVVIRASAYERPPLPQGLPERTVWALQVAAVAECSATGEPEAVVRERAARVGIPGDQVDAGLLEAASWTA